MSLTTYDFELDIVGQTPQWMTVVRGACTVVASGGSKIARVTQASGVFCDALLTNVPSGNNFDVQFTAVPSAVQDRHAILMFVNDAISQGYLMQFDKGSSGLLRIYRLTA